MDIEKLIERLRKHRIIYKTNYDEFSGGACTADCVDAADDLTALLAENEKLRAENIRWGHVASEQGKHLDKLRADLERMRESLDFVRTKDAEIARLGLELEVRKRQEEAMTDIANDFQRQLHTALDELEQVKHQRDSYRLYHDDLASKPNCNTCADKDCKYRPIPGDTVRANCPLWRGAEED